MNQEKVNEILARAKNGEASKEEIIALLTAMNIELEAYKALIEEVKKEASNNN